MTEDNITYRNTTPSPGNISSHRVNSTNEILKYVDVVKLNMTPLPSQSSH